MVITRRQSSKNCSSPATSTRQSNVTDYFSTTSSGRSRNCDKKFKVVATLSSGQSNNDKDEAFAQQSTRFDSFCTPDKSEKMLAIRVTRSSSRKMIQYGPTRSIEQINSPIQKQCKTNVSPKKMLINTKEIKEKLKECKNLTKLKKHLATIEKCTDKLKQNNPIFNETKDSCKNKLPCSRKLFDTIDNSAHESSIDNQYSLNVPVHYKRAYLTKKTIENDDQKEILLELPRSYNLLLNIFALFDEIVSIKHKRQQVCTFEKIKLSIESSTNRTFDLTTIAKILTVLSISNKRWYRLLYEVLDRRHQLTIEPIYQTNGQCINSISLLIERKKEFHLALIDLVKIEHLKFLASKNLSLSTTDKVYQWHPLFELDSVNDIVPNLKLLPVVPNKKNKKSSKEAGENGNSILKYLVKRTPLADKSEHNPQELMNQQLEKSLRIESGRFKGIKMDLLQKIRDKEARINQVQNENCSHELITLNRLPKTIRILNQFFQNTSARSHTMENVIKTIESSAKCSKDLAVKCVEELIEFESVLAKSLDINYCPWITKHKSSENGNEYLLIVPDYNLVTSLFRHIEARIKKLT